MHTPKIDIEFDPAKAKSNLSKHKVSFSQAEEALSDPMSLTIEIPDADGSSDSAPWALTRSAEF